MTQLAEEGAVQVFRPLIGTDYILGAVGVLQFDVTMARLKTEYGVDAVYEPIGLCRGPLDCLRRQEKARRVREEEPGNLAYDCGRPPDLPRPDEWRLGFVMEDWPDIAFHKTREHR